MKRTFCDLCHREVSFAHDNEQDIPYELIEFDLCNDCMEDVSY